MLREDGEDLSPWKQDKMVTDSSSSRVATPVCFMMANPCASLASVTPGGCATRYNYSIFWSPDFQNVCSYKHEHFLPTECGNLVIKNVIS